MTSIDDQQFYVGQKAFIRKADDVLVIRESSKGLLDFPGGMIKAGEMNLSESLKREVEEEVGLIIDIKRPFAVWRNTFLSGHRYAGQALYLVAFQCDIVSGEVRLSNEHLSYQWVNRNNFRDVDDGTQYFKILEKYFSL